MRSGPCGHTPPRSCPARPACCGSTSGGKQARSRSRVWNTTQASARPRKHLSGRALTQDRGRSRRGQGMGARDPGLDRPDDRHYHGVVAAARTGIEAAPSHSVAIQLSAQEAKAWVRIGDRRATEVALDKGRRLLEAIPYPDNLDHHFVFDPTKFDFYSMDCYRHLAEDRLAETLANDVIHASTDFDGTERAPMRLAEARITPGVVAARQGDLGQAIPYASVPSAPRASRCHRCSWSAVISPGS